MAEGGYEDALDVIEQAIAENEQITRPLGKTVPVRRGLLYVAYVENYRTGERVKRVRALTWNGCWNRAQRAYVRLLNAKETA